MKQNGNDGSTIDLGDVKVSTSPSGVSVTFRCEYPLDISLTSKSFSVKSVEGHGTQTAVGNLADGFSLSVNDDEIIIGQMLQVSVTWSLSLSDIVFYLRDCAVEQGESSVSVIQDGCFSEALKESLKCSTMVNPMSEQTKPLFAQNIFFEEYFNLPHFRFFTEYGIPFCLAKHRILLRLKPNI